MIPETVGYIVPVITNPIPTDIGEYIAIDDSLPSGLVWIKQPSRTGHRMVGKPAGSLDARGYYRVTFKSNRYPCHRVIHYLLTGEDPGDNYVDHREDRSNIGTNLRPATPQQNQFNRRSLGNFTSKYKGVSWHKCAKKWQVQIKFNGVKKNLGLYITEEDAAYAYNIAASILHGEYCRLNELPDDYNTNLFEYMDKVIKKAHELLATN